MIVTSRDGLFSIYSHVQADRMIVVRLAYASESGEERRKIEHVVRTKNVAMFVENETFYILCADFSGDELSDLIREIESAVANIQMPYGVMGRAYIGYASVSEVNEVLADTECTNSKIFEYLCLMAETRAQIEEIVNRVIQLVDLSIAIERRDASGGYDVAGHTGEWEAGEHDSPHTTLVMMRRSRPETEFFAVVLAHAAERILIDTDGTERKIIEAACRAAIEAGATIT